MHYTVVFVGLSIAVLSLARDELWAIAPLAVPCAIGWGVAHALDRAAHDVAAIPDAT